MEIKYVKQKNIDKDKWNECVYKSQNTYIYGFSWFLDIIAVDWDGLILGDYEAVMPLTKKHKYFIQYLYQPVFIQKVNVYSIENITQKKLHEFLKAIPSKFILIDINIDVENPDLDKNYQIFPKANYELDLNNTYENIYSNYRRNTKRNIKKALKNNIIVKKETDFSNFIKTRRDTTFARNQKNIRDFHFTRLSKLLQYLSDNNSLLIYNAYTSDGVFCASSCYYFSKKRATISHTATVNGITQKANFLTVNKFIEDHAGKNIILDLAGSNLEGVAYFNSGFGAINKPYSRIYKSNSKILQRIKKIVKK